MNEGILLLKNMYVTPPLWWGDMTNTCNVYFINICLTCAGMDHGHRANMEAFVESRSSCSFRRTGQCFEVEGLPADTPCSTQGCTDWCHYEPCFTRFCEASEFYPDVDTNPLRVGLMVPLCQVCAILRRQEYRDQQNQVRLYPNRGSDSNTTQEYENEDSNTTQEMDPEYIEILEFPVG